MLRSGRSMAALCAGVLTGTMALAQGSGPQDVVFVSRSMDSCESGMVFDRTLAPGPGGRTQAKATTGAPYSGVGTTRVVRTLADGNRIVRTNTMRYARDGQGRTRTEYALAALGPFALEESRSLITVEDPVAQRRYMINSDQRQATVFDTAREQAVFTKMLKKRSEAVADAGADGGTQEAISVTTSGPGTFVAASGSGTVVATSGSGTIASTAYASGPAPIAGKSFFAAGTPMPLVPGCGPGMHSRKLPPAVSLGERSIEGVKVIGSRHEYEIPAGEIGNEQPIRVRTEQWFSPDLGVVVESLHQDPMVGETSYKLSQIRRGEPDAALFTIPAGYTVQEAPAPKFEVFERPAPPRQ